MGFFKEWTIVRLPKKDAAKVVAILENLDIQVSEPEIDCSRDVVFQVRAPKMGVLLLIHSLGIGVDEGTEDKE